MSSQNTPQTPPATNEPSADEMTYSLRAIGGDIESLTLIAAVNDSNPSVELNADAVDGDMKEYVIVQGCKRMSELLHRNPINKIEATTRNAFEVLLNAIEENKSKPLVLREAIKTLRSLSFNNPTTREKSVNLNVCFVLSEAMKVSIESVKSYLMPSPETMSGAAVAILVAWLGVIDEAMVLITSLSHNNEHNTIFSIKHAVPDMAKDVISIVQNLSTQNNIVQALQAAASPSMNTLKSKALFLTMLSEPGL